MPHNIRWAEMYVSENIVIINMQMSLESLYGTDGNI
jgi:hypothetical protein